MADVAFDLRAGRANVTFKPGAQIDEDALRTAIKKAGFTVDRIEINGETGDAPPGQVRRE